MMRVNEGNSHKGSILIFPFSLFTPFPQLRAAGALTSAVWLKALHSAHPTLSDVWTHCSLDEHSHLTPHYSPQKEANGAIITPDFGLALHVDAARRNHLRVAVCH